MNTAEKRKSSKKKKKKRKIVLFIIEILVLLILLGVLAAVQKLDKMNEGELDKEDLEINIDEEQQLRQRKQ